MTLLRSLSLGFLVTLTLAACGGATFDGESGSGLEADGGGSGGEGGGTAGSGGEGGGSAGSGTAGGGGGTAVGGSTGTGGGMGGGTAGGGMGGGSAGGTTACCLAMAVCNPGDRQIEGPGDCPAGAECYSNSICCSTVWCAAGIATCDAFPACDPGDREFAGSCPPAYSCYQRSVCGSTITCLEQLEDGGPAPIAVDAGGSCDPAAQPDRHYVADSPEKCAVIDYLCPATTRYFHDACGCGCEQDPSCPDWVDCMPGPGVPDPACTDGDQNPCPYSGRAY